MLNVLFLKILILSSCSFDERFNIDLQPQIVAGSKLLRAQDSVSIRLFYPATDLTNQAINWSSNIGKIRSTNGNFIFIAPDSAGLAKIKVTIKRHNGKVYENNLNILVFKQLVIIKADDMVFDRHTSIPKNWKIFTDYILSRNLKASIGLIGNSLEAGDEKYFSYLKSLDSCGNFEIWNHGYDHRLNWQDSYGITLSEFRNTSFEHQLKHLTLTQDLAMQKLGLILNTFGAPGNQIDSTTLKAISEVKNLKIWLFGMGSSKLNIKRNIDLEYPAGNVDFEKFRKAYSHVHPYICLQIHPNSWDYTDYIGFIKCMDFLEEKGVTFINPYEYFMLKKAN